MLNFSGDEPELIEQFDANLRAIRAYRPGRLRASLTLFRADTQLLSNLALDSTLGWSDLVEGKVCVRIVPGNHHTMTTEPLVGTLPRHYQLSFMRLKEPAPCRIFRSTATAKSARLWPTR